MRKGLAPSHTARQHLPACLPHSRSHTLTYRNNELLKGWQEQDLEGLRQDTSLDSSPSTIPSSPCPSHVKQGASLTL